MSPPALMNCDFFYSTYGRSGNGACLRFEDFLIPFDLLDRDD